MIFTIINSFVRVTAESDSDNLKLLKLNGVEAAPQKESEGRDVPIRIIRRRRKQRTRIARTPEQIAETDRLKKERQSGMALLREQINSIGIGQSGFITTDVASATRNLKGYVYYIGQHSHPQAPVHVSAYKKYGGYEVSVRK